MKLAQIDEVTKIKKALDDIQRRLSNLGSKNSTKNVEVYLLVQEPKGWRDVEMKLDGKTHSVSLNVEPDSMLGQVLRSTVIFQLEQEKKTLLSALEEYGVVVSGSPREAAR